VLTVKPARSGSASSIVGDGRDAADERCEEISRRLREHRDFPEDEDNGDGLPLYLAPGRRPANPDNRSAQFVTWGSLPGSVAFIERRELALLAQAKHVPHYLFTRHLPAGLLVKLLDHFRQLLWLHQQLI